VAVTYRSDLPLWLAALCCLHLSLDLHTHTHTRTARTHMHRGCCGIQGVKSGRLELCIWAQRIRNATWWQRCVNSIASFVVSLKYQFNYSPRRTRKMDIPCPERFSFEPKLWPAWRQRFERFRTASDLATKTADRQISMSLYCMGEHSEDIFSRFTYTTDESKNN
jgi:hypothetical protein